MRTIFTKVSIAEDQTVSDLSNEAPVQDKPFADERSYASPKVMLVTMILLIAALMLTGTMMLYYASTRDGQLVDAAEKQNDSSFSMSTLLEKVRKPDDAAAANPTDITEPENGSSGFSLFGNRSDKVRWPKLKLTGFGTATDGSESFAIINNHHYHQGQLINGKITLQEVRDYDVVVVYMGETNTLTVNVQD